MPEYAEPVLIVAALIVAVVVVAWLLRRESS